MTEDGRVEDLIEAQRRYSISPNPFERVIGSLLVAGLLKEKLGLLSNDAVGQLMFDVVWNVMDVFSPELAICQAATERLRNSSSVVVTTE
jgi:hypothetical protein